MLKLNLNQVANVVAVPTTVDGNGIPYIIERTFEMAVSVYDYVLMVLVEGRKYTSLNGEQFMKVSYVASRQLCGPQGTPIPFILKDRLSPNIAQVDLENLVADDVEQVCKYSTDKSGKPVAPIEMLGAFGAKLDKSGWPVLFEERLIEVRPAKGAKVDEVVAVRVLYSTSRSRTYVNAFPQVRADANVYAGATRELGKVSLTEQPYSSVEFLSNKAAIHEQVVALVRANF